MCFSLSAGNHCQVALNCYMVMNETKVLADFP